MDSDPIRLSLTSSSSLESELSEFSGSAVLLAANLSALCKKVIWVTASVNLLTCSIWHLKYPCSWVSIEVRVFCKTSVKALNISLLLSMISPAARELEVAQDAWLLEGTPPYLEFSVWSRIDVVSVDKVTTSLELLALEKWRRGFSGILAELIHYGDAIDYVMKLRFLRGSLKVLGFLIGWDITKNGWGWRVMFYFS